MFDFNTILDFLLGDLKNIFFPKDWIAIDLKFSKSELFTLLLIDKRNEITMTELVEYINSPMSTATGIADRLVKSGLIARDRSELDRRLVVLRLTPQGTTLITNLKDTISGYFGAVVGELTPEEKQFLAGIALKIFNCIKEKLQEKKPFEDSNQALTKINIE